MRRVEPNTGDHDRELPPDVGSPGDASVTARVLAGIRELEVAMGSVRSAFSHRHGLATGDSMVITVLAIAGKPMTPTEVSRSLPVSSGTLTNMIDRLEAAQLLQRIPNPADRRSVMLQLTSAMVEEVRATELRLRRGIAATLAADELEHFAATLTAVAAAMRISRDDSEHMSADGSADEQS